MWTFAPTACGHALGYYIDFGYSVALFGIIMVLDVVTLAVLRGAHRVCFKSFYLSVLSTKLHRTCGRV